MNEAAFLEKMTGVLETEDKITMTDVLDDVVEWDSLAFVNFLGMADAEYSKKISVSQLRQARSIADLYHLLLE